MEAADRPTLAFDLVAGARPNFVKLAPVRKALEAIDGIQVRVVHTGQHYDEGLSDVFFRDLRMPDADVHLDVGPDAAGAQTARIRERYEVLLLTARPDATVVFGDVNSTLAAAQAASNASVPVVHVEAGLRSFDRSMPEETNRILTDQLSSLLLVTEQSGVDNLEREGIAGEHVRLVGNPMVDALETHRPLFTERKRAEALGLDTGGYGVVTLHRPHNVDDAGELERIVSMLVRLSERLPLVFPVHPRTAAVAERAGLDLSAGARKGRILCLGPEPYLDHLSLLSGAAVVLTDSGGMQAECAALRVPCLVLRDRTEHVALVDAGAVRVVGATERAVRTAFGDALDSAWPESAAIDLWDGHAAERVADEVARFFARPSGPGVSHPSDARG